MFIRRVSGRVQEIVSKCGWMQVSNRAWGSDLTHVGARDIF